MADPPSSRRPGSSPDFRSSSPDGSERSGGPPSEPKILVAKPGAAEADRAPRIQLVAALLLLLVLVVVPLYLWRRPRVVHPENDREGTSPPASLASVPVLAGQGDAGAPFGANAEVSRSREGLSLSETRVLECHDPGPKRTAAADCDRLPVFERAFAEAILANAACAAGGGGGDVVWVADASYQRKRSPIQLSVGREGRTIKNPKVVSMCLTAVRKSLMNVQPEPLDATHAHTRYKLEITATYAAHASEK